MSEKSYTEQKRNYKIFLAQGSFVDMALNFADPVLVLPWLFVLSDGPLRYAPLIVPIYQIGSIFSNLRGAKWAESRSQMRYLLAFLSALNGIVVAILGLTHLIQRPILEGWIFATGAWALGALGGSTSVIYLTTVSRCFDSKMQHRLLYAQNIWASIVTILCAWMMHQLSSYFSQEASHYALIYLSAIAFLIASVLLVPIREPAFNPVHEKIQRPMHQELWRLLKEPWVQSYIWARVGLLSVVLATPFYAIHTAITHGAQSGSLSLVIVASSLGTLLSGIIWQKFENLGARVTMVLCAILSVFIAILSFVASEFDFGTLLLQATMFGVLIFAQKGIWCARRLYLLSRASETDRAKLIGLTNLIIGAAGVPVAYLMGVLAEIKGTHWPILVLAALTICTLPLVFRLDSIQNTAQQKN